MAETKKENWFKRAWTRTRKFSRDLWSELKKVTWPTWPQVLRNALVVLACVVVVGIFVWLFDAVATGLVGLLVK